MKPLGLGLGLATVTLAADLASKEMAMQVLADRIITLLPGYFDLVLMYNKGAAFSMFANSPPAFRDFFLIGVAVVASVFILHLLRRSRHPLEGSGLGLVLGGAVGNLIDRLRFGSVVDFVHLHWHDLSWPVFNLADSAITLGVAMLLWENLFLSSKPEGEP